MIYLLNAWPLCLLFLNSVVAKRYYITSNGECDDCGRRATTDDYNWCYSSENGYFSKAYCSTDGGLTTRDKKCITDCDFYGKSYMWCYTDFNGVWDYCSQVEDNSFTYFTSSNEECIDTCQNYHGLFYCYKRNGISGECSPFEEVTFKGNICWQFLKDELYEYWACEKHGWSYYWCYSRDLSNDGGWNYCSKLESDANLETSDQNLRIIQSITQRLRAGQSLTTYIAYEKQETTDLLRLVDQTLNVGNDAMAVVLQWSRDEDCFYQRNEGTLKAIGTIRLYYVGVFNRNCTKYANLQLQIIDKSEPATLAQVSVEVGNAGDNAMRFRRMNCQRVIKLLTTAFYASLKHARKVWVFQELVDFWGNVIPRDTQHDPLA